MQINSKYDPGKTIHFMYHNEPVSGKITGVNLFYGSYKTPDGKEVSTPDGTCDNHYFVEGFKVRIGELKAFETQEELMKSLFTEEEK